MFALSACDANGSPVTCFYTTDYKCFVLPVSARYTSGMATNVLNQWRSPIVTDVCGARRVMKMEEVPLRNRFSRCLVVLAGVMLAASAQAGTLTFNSWSNNSSYNNFSYSPGNATVNPNEFAVGVRSVYLGNRAGELERPNHHLGFADVQQHRQLERQHRRVVHPLA